MSRRPEIPIVDVLGVHIGVLTPDRLIREVESMVTENQHGYISFAGVHGVMECQRDPSLMTIFNEAAIAAPDGMPMVWAARLAGVTGGGRCYGPDCMLMACCLAESNGWPIFLYGGKDDVATILATRLSSQFPKLRIAGIHSPPFRPLTQSEIDDEVSMINGSGARLVFVGIGTPKQDRWMADRMASLQANVLFGVGAAFDFHAGSVRQAPQWMRNSGLEWLFRMMTEPRRLSGRYLRNNPAFVWRIVRNRPRAGQRNTESTSAPRTSESPSGTSGE